MIRADAHAPPRSIRWPTLALAAVIYGGWGALIWHHEAVPLWITLPLGAWLIAWQSSLQHELVHENGTPWPLVNTALALPSLLLWVPFHRYRDLHLRHHNDARLTDPFEDPETRYVSATTWAGYSAPYRLWQLAQRTLLGRLALGPLCAASSFFGSELRAILRADRAVIRAWAIHLPVAAGIVVWAVGVCGLPVLELVAMTYLATSLILLRSFAEHRAAADPRHRTAIVEDSPVFGLLFLFNNLHIVHHLRPGLPWYQIPAAYRAERDRWIACNGGLIYRGYRDVARRFLVSVHDHPVHPRERGAA